MYMYMDTDISLGADMGMDMNIDMYRISRTPVTQRLTKTTSS